jgi:hypothetical protein
MRHPRGIIPKKRDKEEGGEERRDKTIRRMYKKQRQGCFFCSKSQREVVD